MEEADNTENGPIPQIDDSSSTPAKSCALCGCSTPAVRCDRCSSQIFCLSCDDMYHRHPKRRLHLRKAVDSIWTSTKSPKLRRRTELPGDPSKIPIPPPRSKKRERHNKGGRIFLRPGLELGSFGQNKIFDVKSLIPPKDVYSKLKIPANTDDGMYENEAAVSASNNFDAQKKEEIYENDSIINQNENMDITAGTDQTPWNSSSTNVSPIQVSIPSNTLEQIASDQHHGFMPKPHSRSITDLNSAAMSPGGQHAYHLPHPYPYMHPPFQPPYSHSMAHLNCSQCMSSSWSNLMSPHPSPYFHPMPWGPPHASMGQNGTIPPGPPGHMKHSHGDLETYPDPNFHFPYPGGAYYPNGFPISDPNKAKELPQQISSKVRRSPSTSRSPRQVQSTEDLQSTAAAQSESNVNKSAELSNKESAAKAKQTDVEDEPKAPVAPSEPWSCLHCTFINPAGIYICQVCCKTSYGNKSSSDIDENRMESPIINDRNSESPMELVNRDAEIMSADFLNMKAQKTEDDICQDSLETSLENEVFKSILDDNEAKTPDSAIMLTTETQTATTTKSTDVQTQSLVCKSMASSTDSIFPKTEMSVQTEVEELPKHCSVATDPMISSQSIESLMSGMSAPPYHNRRAGGWGRGTSYSTQSLYERGRSRSPLPRSASLYNESHPLVRDSSLPPEEVLHSWNPAWLMTDPMYYKPHDLPEYGQALTKEDYFDGTWGSMDKLNRRVKSKQPRKQDAFNKPKYHRSLDDLKTDKNQEIVHSRELQFLHTVKEAERCGFSLEDLHVAYLHCGRENPVLWLEDNWSSMIKNVIALAAKYGEDNEENDVGVISSSEAKEALHIHRGDIWDAVTECIENRQRKILELTVRGNFTQKQISDALTHNNGNVELAFADLFRASNKRHKFILSPGLSEDSEDLNISLQMDEGGEASATKRGRLNASPDSRTEKKKSDFLSKLTAIRQAQSERRKAREEKELVRETVVQDLPAEHPVTSAESPHFSGLSKSPETGELSKEGIREGNSLIQAGFDLDIQKEKDQSKQFDKNDSQLEKIEHEGLPEDYDANWVDSQGEWIEEFSDEQWDEEGDGQWVTLHKKFHNMEKELAEEAMQMAALWEKEELEDDVFEEEEPESVIEVQQKEFDKLKTEQDEKFEQWVKVNLDKNLSETEEEALSEKHLKLEAKDILSKSVELEDSIICESPLQHYPTEFDLSSKTLTEPDWIKIEANVSDQVKEESEKPKDKTKAHQYESIDIQKIPQLVKYNDQNLSEVENSDAEWEKVELEDLPPLKEKDEPFVDKVLTEKIFLDSFSVEPHLEATSNLETNLSDSVLEDLPQNKMIEDKYVERKKESEIHKEVSPPKPPVRRKSKLSVSAIEEVLRNQSVSSDSQPNIVEVPPALPMKMKDKIMEQNIAFDIYAVPDKGNKSKPVEIMQFVTSQAGNNDINLINDSKENIIVLEPAPAKPPRLNIPSSEVEFSKEPSPVTSLSNESDSNCFADSESDPEIKIVRQKMHRKYSRHENDGEINQEESQIPDNEPLKKPLTQDEDFGPELPIPLGSRGICTKDDISSPKAFREGTARPLQLFKVNKSDTNKIISPITPNNEKSGFDEATKEISSYKLSAEKSDLNSFVEPVLPSVSHSLESTQISYDSSYYNTNIKAESDKFVSQNILHAEEIDNQELETQTESNLDASISYNNVEHRKVELPPEETNFHEEVPQIISDVLLQNSESTELFPPSSIEQPQLTETNINDQKEEELLFTEMEAMSAAADYFFGRYNEVTVTRPKKKTIVVVGKSGMPAMPKPISASQTKASTPTKSPVIEKRTSPVLVASADKQLSAEHNFSLSSTKSSSFEEKNIPLSEKKELSTNTFLQEPHLNQAMPVISGRKDTSGPPQETAPIETLSFAEDYFFGSYNEVSPPKKPKNKPIATKAKLQQQTFTQNSISNLSLDSSSCDWSETDQVTSLMVGSMPSISEEGEGPEPLPQFLSTSMAAGSHQETDLGNTMKAVHFEDPSLSIVPPPRKNRGQSTSKSDKESKELQKLNSQNERYSRPNMMDKKKLQPYSKDFKLFQEHDPEEIPCETPFQSIEESESLLSSEISFHTSEKLKNESFMNSIDDRYFQTECGTCEPLQDCPQVSKSFDTFSTPDSSNLSTQNDINHCLFTTDEVKNLPLAENISLAVDGLTPDPTMVDYKLGSSYYECDTKSNNSLDQTSLSNEALIKQNSNDFGKDISSVHDSFDEDSFQLVVQNQDILNDFCDLYMKENFNLTSSNELESYNVKNNNQETTYDSEHEWKLNEERNNSLNANFIENPLYESQGKSSNVIEENNLIIINNELISTEIDIEAPIPIEVTAEINKSSLTQEEVITGDYTSHNVDLDETLDFSIQTSFENTESFTYKPLSLKELCTTNIISKEIESADSLINNDYGQSSKSIDHTFQAETEDDREVVKVEDEMVKTDSNIVQPLAFLCQSVAQTLESSSSSYSVLLEEACKSYIQDSFDSLVEIESETFGSKLNSFSDESLSGVSVIEKKSSVSKLDLSANEKNYNLYAFKTVDDSNRKSESGLNNELLENSYSATLENRLLTDSTDYVKEDKELETIDDTKSDFEEVSILKVSDELNNEKTDSKIHENVDTVPFLYSSDTLDNVIALTTECTNETSIETSSSTDTTEMDIPQVEVDEEPDLSLMSHFYDEWFDYVKPNEASEKTNLLNVYASYSPSNSSATSSGHASDVEDFVEVKKEDIVAVGSDSYSKETFGENMLTSNIFKGEAVEIDSALPEISASINNQFDSLNQLQYTEENENISQTGMESSEYLSYSYDKKYSITNFNDEADIEFYENSSITISEFIKDNDNRQVVESDYLPVVSHEQKLYRTSKSCQTEDSFEEDQFFDSFDDTFTIPSFLNVPFNKAIADQPSKAEIGVQCTLIEDVSSFLDNHSKNSFSNLTLKQETKTQLSQEYNLFDDVLEEDSEMHSVASTLQNDSKANIAEGFRDSSSSDSFGDSDSDLYIESHSSYDELNTENKTKKVLKHSLYADIDSDTGFSSGSDTGKCSTAFKETHSSENNVILMQGLSVESMDVHISSNNQSESNMVISEISKFSYESVDASSLNEEATNDTVENILCSDQLVKKICNEQTFSQSFDDAVRENNTNYDNESKVESQSQSHICADNFDAAYEKKTKHPSKSPVSALISSPLDSIYGDALQLSLPFETNENDKLVTSFTDDILSKEKVFIENVLHSNEKSNTSEGESIFYLEDDQQNVKLDSSNLDDKKVGEKTDFHFTIMQALISSTHVESDLGNVEFTSSITDDKEVTEKIAFGESASNLNDENDVQSIISSHLMVEQQSFESTLCNIDDKNVNDKNEFEENAISAPISPIEDQPNAKSTLSITDKKEMNKMYEVKENTLHSDEKSDTQVLTSLSDLDSNHHKLNIENILYNADDKEVNLKQKVKESTVNLGEKSDTLIVASFSQSVDDQQNIALDSYTNDDQKLKTYSCSESQVDEKYHESITSECSVIECKQTVIVSEKSVTVDNSTKSQDSLANSKCERKTVEENIETNLVGQSVIENDLKRIILVTETINDKNLNECKISEDLNETNNFEESKLNSDAKNDVLDTDSISYLEGNQVIDEKDNIFNTEELLERAVTPLSIKKISSYEYDLNFVDVEEAVEEMINYNMEKPSVPTVEYFYGPLPLSIENELGQNWKESFFEALDILDECVSDLENNISENQSFYEVSDGLESKSASEIFEKEDTENYSDAASTYNDDDLNSDSVSEYFAMSDSEIEKFSFKNENATDFKVFVMGIGHQEKESSEVVTDDIIFKEKKKNYPVVSNADTQNKITYSYPHILENLSDSSNVQEKEIDPRDSTSQSGYSVELDKSCGMQDLDKETSSLKEETSQIEKSTCQNLEIISFNHNLNLNSTEKRLNGTQTEKSDINVVVFNAETLKYSCESELLKQYETPSVKSKNAATLDISKSLDELVPVTDVQDELVTKPSTVVSQAPSDIVRYLYYDDSIQFDDNSQKSEEISSFYEFSESVKCEITKDLEKILNSCSNENNELLQKDDSSSELKHTPVNTILNPQYKPKPEAEVLETEFLDEVELCNLTQTSVVTSFETVEESECSDQWVNLSKASISLQNLRSDFQGKSEEVLKLKPIASGDSNFLGDQISSKISHQDLVELCNPIQTPSETVEEFECSDQWMDLSKASISLQKSQSDFQSILESEEFLKLKSTASEDRNSLGDPIVILKPDTNDNALVSKVDIDEVTDISTHFTMTDDSDKLSDIESDVSLTDDKCYFDFENLDFSQENFENKSKNNADVEPNKLQKSLQEDEIRGISSNKLLQSIDVFHKVDVNGNVTTHDDGLKAMTTIDKSDIQEEEIQNDQFDKCSELQEQSSCITENMSEEQFMELSQYDIAICDKNSVTELEVSEYFIPSENNLTETDEPDFQDFSATSTVEESITTDQCDDYALPLESIEKDLKPTFSVCKFADSADLINKAVLNDSLFDENADTNEKTCFQTRDTKLSQSTVLNKVTVNEEQIVKNESITNVMEKGKDKKYVEQLPTMSGVMQVESISNSSKQKEMNLTFVSRDNLHVSEELKNEVREVQPNRLDSDTEASARSELCQKTESLNVQADAEKCSLSESVRQFVENSLISKKEETEDSTSSYCTIATSSSVSFEQDSLSELDSVKELKCTLHEKSELISSTLEEEINSKDKEVLKQIILPPSDDLEKQKSSQFEEKITSVDEFKNIGYSKKIVNAAVSESFQETEKTLSKITSTDIQAEDIYSVVDFKGHPILEGFVNEKDQSLAESLSDLSIAEITNSTSSFITFADNEKNTVAQRVDSTYKQNSTSCIKEDSENIVDFKGYPLKLLVDTELNDISQSEVVKKDPSEVHVTETNKINSISIAVDTSVVDFKGCPTIDEKLVHDNSYNLTEDSFFSDTLEKSQDYQCATSTDEKYSISFDQAESVDKFHLHSTEEAYPIVDFKGQPVTEENILNEKYLSENQFKLSNYEEIFSTVDFIGQKSGEAKFISEIDSSQLPDYTVSQIDDKKTTDKKSLISFEQIDSVENIRLHSTGEACPIVDFKGQPETDKNISSEKHLSDNQFKLSYDEEISTTVDFIGKIGGKAKFVSEIDSSQSLDYITSQVDELVDIKGQFTVDEALTNEISSYKLKKSSDSKNLEEIDSTVDFKGSFVNITNSMGNLIGSEVLDTNNSDANKIISSMLETKTEIRDGEAILKKWNELSENSPLQKTILQPRTTEETITELVEKDINNEINYSSDVENSYISCVETESSLYHSAVEDYEDTLNITSDDDFTDVPSHATLTDDTDVWTDVEADEGEFDLEDFSFTKETTPTKETLTSNIIELRSSMNPISQIMEACHESYLSCNEEANKTDFNIVEENIKDNLNLLQNSDKIDRVLQLGQIYYEEKDEFSVCTVKNEKIEKSSVSEEKSSSTDLYSDNKEEKLECLHVSENSTLNLSSKTDKISESYDLAIDLYKKSTSCDIAVPKAAPDECEKSSNEIEDSEQQQIIDRSEMSSFDIEKQDIKKDPIELNSAFKNSGDIVRSSEKIMKINVDENKEKTATLKPTEELEPKMLSHDVLNIQSNLSDIHQISSNITDFDVSLNDMSFEVNTPEITATDDLTYDSVTDECEKWSESEATNSLEESFFLNKSCTVEDKKSIADIDYKSMESDSLVGVSRNIHAINKNNQENLSSFSVIEEENLKQYDNLVESSLPFSETDNNANAVKKEQDKCIAPVNSNLIGENNSLKLSESSVFSTIDNKTERREILPMALDTEAIDITIISSNVENIEVDISNDSVSHHHTETSFDSVSDECEKLSERESPTSFDYSISQSIEKMEAKNITPLSDEEVLVKMKDIAVFSKSEGFTKFSLAEDETPESLEVGSKDIDIAAKEIDQKQSSIANVASQQVDAFSSKDFNVSDSDNSLALTSDDAFTDVTSAHSKSDEFETWSEEDGSIPLDDFLSASRETIQQVENYDAEECLKHTKEDSLQTDTVDSSVLSLSLTSRTKVNNNLSDSYECDVSMNVKQLEKDPEISLISSKTTESPIKTNARERPLCPESEDDYFDETENNFKKSSTLSANVDNFKTISKPSELNQSDIKLNEQPASTLMKSSTIDNDSEEIDVLLVEQFAEMKSLSEYLNVVESFAIINEDIAVPRIHEETNEASLRLEKTEDSDYWIEADTEHSISEFEDEAVSLSYQEKYRQSSSSMISAYDILEDNKKGSAGSHRSSENATEISVSSFFTDPEQSGNVSDTCADISLQGATTENSDKWSDIEGDGLIDEALYGPDQSIDVKENYFAKESNIEQDELNLAQETKNAQSTINIESSNSFKDLSGLIHDLKEVQIITEIKELESSSVVVCSVEPATPTDSCVDLSDRNKSTSVKNESLQREKAPFLSEIPASSVLGLSDDEFTNVTPLDVTVEESDKWSDISDTSIEEIEEDTTSVSMTGKTQSNPPSKVTPSKESFNSAKPETIVSATSDTFVQESENKLSSLFQSAIEKDSTENANENDAIESAFYNSKTNSDIVSTHLPMQYATNDIESINELNEKDLNNDAVEAQSQLEVEPLSQSPHEYITNEMCEGLNDEEFIEETDDFDIPYEENDLEVDEDGYPGFSTPYVINDDEFVYPIQYPDWIEESFDLKEYGIETVLSGSESDVHGFGIQEEFEDIERAIDMNISNFDETLDSILEDERNLTTESFKTLSNGTSSHLKPSDLEHDSWSTADAASIEDDLPEHDDVLSRIDELLAEDFKDFDDGYREDNEVGEEQDRLELSPLEELDEKDYSDERNLFQIDEDVIKNETCYIDSINEKELIEEENGYKKRCDKDLSRKSFDGDENFSLFDKPLKKQSMPVDDISISMTDGSNIENEIDKLVKKNSLISEENDIDERVKIISEKVDSETILSEKFSCKSGQKANLTSTADENQLQSNIPLSTSEKIIVKPSGSNAIVKTEKNLTDSEVNETGNIVKDSSNEISLKTDDNLENKSGMSEKRDKSLKNNSKPADNSSFEESKSQSQDRKSISVSEEISVKEEEIVDSKFCQEKKNLTLSSDLGEQSSSIPCKTTISKSSEDDNVEAKDNLVTETKKETSSESQNIEKLKEDVKILPPEESSVVSIETPKPDIPNKQRNKAKCMNAAEIPSDSLSLGKTIMVKSDEITEKDSSKKDCPSSVNKAGLVETDIPNEEDKPIIQKENADVAPALPRKRRRDVASIEAKSTSSSTESLSSCELSTSSHGGENACESSSIPDVPVRRRRSIQSPSVQSRRKSSSDSFSSSVSKSSEHSNDSTGPELTRKRLSIDERVAKLQNEGKCSNKETAFIAAKLIEMQFEEEDALLASKQCSSVYHAVKFLTQLCELCNCRFPINLMVSMVHCTHRACKECLKAHFTTLIYDRSIFSLLCPICHLPDITDQNIQEYFNHLDIMLRRILESNVYDLFQRKLRDEVLTKDPNFHWCSQCSSGFIASPRLKKLYCPDCLAITCASCHQTWELEHEGVHCERFQQWKDMHTPEPPPAGLVKYLTDRGINCPFCGLLYNQACGGCLIYKCSHCSYEFCGFCIRALKRAKDCSNRCCISRGMHIHHPLNCLFFIRDKEISDLQMLLDEESVEYLTIPPKDQIVKSRCQVREQKHIHGTTSEDRCGRDIVPYCAGLCRTHYYEYLAELLRKNKISPLSIMTSQDLQFMLRKSRVHVPEKIKGETNEEYYSRLTKIVTSSLN